MNDSEESSHVLIVDDEERVASTYELRLDTEYETEIALSGEAALEMVDDHVDVVLLDRRMPGTSGDEVLEEIRRMGHDCRVVMLTAVDPNFDITDMEFDDYVVKPVDKDELQTVVERALTIADYNEQMQELSALKLKRNVLEVELGDYELEESEKYMKLVDQIEELEAEIEDMEAELDLDQVDLYL